MPLLLFSFDLHIFNSGERDSLTLIHNLIGVAEPITRVDELTSAKELYDLIEHGFTEHS